MSRLVRAIMLRPFPRGNAPIERGVAVDAEFGCAIRLPSISALASYEEIVGGIFDEGQQGPPDAIQDAGLQQARFHHSAASALATAAGHFSAASSARKSRPRVSPPNLAISAMAALAGSAMTSEAGPSGGMPVKIANPCAPSPPSLLQPAIHPDARPRIRSG